MQLGGVGGNLEVLFEQYLHKTMKKTASLMAYACQSVTNKIIVCYGRQSIYIIQVAVLGHCPEALCERAFHYGKNIGLAFQVWMRDDTSLIGCSITDY